MSLPVCKYGATCFQKSLAHSQAYSHPINLKDDAPSCKYGSKCNDLSAVHLNKYSHPSSSTSSSSSNLGKRKRKVIEDSSSDEEEDIPKTKKQKTTEKQTVHEDEEKVKEEEDENDEILSEEEEDEKEKEVEKEEEDERPVCSFGEHCYRTSKDHHKKFSHPKSSGKVSKKKKEKVTVEKKSVKNDSVTIKSMVTRKKNIDEILSSDEESESASAIELPPPKNHLEDGEIKKIQSQSSSSVYQIKRTGDDYYCTCMAWKNQSTAPAFRSCKHLREFLGEEFEKARVSAGGCTLELIKPTEKQKISVLLAQTWNPSIDPTGWYMSEKLDGVRAYWNGKQLLSRLGNPFPIPKWLKKILPKDQELDGELWSSRGAFQTIVSIVKTVNHKHWNTISYQLFDIPSASGDFKQRYEKLKKLCDDVGSPHLKCLEHRVCTGKEDLESFMEEVTDDDGEGVMLRKADSTYQRNRSNTLLKVKTFTDADGKVIGHEDGKGRLKGMTGALVIRMKSGKEFKVGTGFSDEQRRKPPKIGSIITYKYQGLTNDGIPRFPVFVGVRIDKAKPSDPK